MYAPRKNRTQLRKENERIVARLAQLNVKLFQKDVKIQKLESKLADCKGAHYADYAENHKEIVKLKAQNKDLSDANWELNLSIKELNTEINQLTVKIARLESRNLWERIFNKDVEE